MFGSQSTSNISFARIFASSALAACFAICTIPLDTTKVRLQLQKKAALGDEVPKCRGMLRCSAGAKVSSDSTIPES